MQKSVLGSTAWGTDQDLTTAQLTSAQRASLKTLSGMHGKSIFAWPLPSQINTSNSPIARARASPQLFQVTPPTHYFIPTITTATTKSYGTHHRLELLLVCFLSVHALALLVITGERSSALPKSLLGAF
jgi:hypothetical protein